MNLPAETSGYPVQSPEERLSAARSWAQHVEPAAPELRAQSDLMTERLQTVIEAAERAADAIRYDAEDRARRHLADAQQRADRLTAERVRAISLLTDDLIENAASVKRHSEQMISALDQAVDSVAGQLGAVGSAASQNAATAPSTGPAGAGAQAPPAPPPATALLRATQLAAAGGSRASIADAVRSEFGIDPQPVLARILD
jgi:vacuolar-type H+-ATPase subunit H